MDYRNRTFVSYENPLANLDFEEMYKDLTGESLDAAEPGKPRPLIIRTFNGYKLPEDAMVTFNPNNESGMYIEVTSGGNTLGVAKTGEISVDIEKGDVGKVTENWKKFLGNYVP